MQDQIRTTLIIQPNGNISFPDLDTEISPAEITPKKCRELFADFRISEENQGGRDYTRQYFRMVLEETHCTVGFCFYNEQLFSLELSLQLPDTELVANWPTRESCLKKIALVEKIFEKQFGNKLGYGIPFHFYDERSALDCCGISYKMYLQKNYFKQKLQLKNGEFIQFAIVIADGRRYFEEYGTLKDNLLVGVDGLKHQLEICETEEIAMQKAMTTINQYKEKGYTESFD